MHLHYKASRISGSDNVVFPDEIIISDSEVVIRKGQLIGYRATHINRGSIASVSLDVNLLFTDIVIETRGGRSIQVKGFTHDDAKRIARTLNE